MKKAKSDQLRSEYRRDDLGPGVRGKYLDFPLKIKPVFEKLPELSENL